MWVSCWFAVVATCADVLDALKQAWQLAAVSAPKLARLATMLETECVGGGDEIYQRGTHPPAWYIVLSGSVMLTKSPSEANAGSTASNLLHGRTRTPGIFQVRKRDW